jgi:hypothetical protein
VRPELRVTLVCAALTLLGCPAPVVSPPFDAGVDPAPDAGPVDAGAGDAGSTEPADGGLARSAKGNLRFKGDVRLTIDYALALELPFDQVCNELGQYPCSYFVHAVALGGVDPYGKGLYEGQGVTGVTAPMVVERVALAGCLKRVDLDLATPASAVIFRSLPVTAGKLTNPNGSEVRLALTNLVQRAWLRDPTQAELTALIALNADLEASGVTNPAKTWMQAACFAVFSSAEAVFY